VTVRSPITFAGVLLENIKFAHTVFALPFALMAMFLAAASTAQSAGQGDWARRCPHWLVFVLVVGCMVAARSVAMTANRIHDAGIDARNPRTADRPMVTGRLSRRAAWAFLLAMSALFLLSCAGFWIAFANPWPTVLFIPAMVVLCGYPFAKRFTSLSHFWLGLALSLGPVGAWVATSPATLGVEAIVLSAAVLFWAAGFDILYACQDVAVDRRERLFAIPARLGVPAALWISRACHLLAAVLLVMVGRLDGQLGWLYWMGVAMACGLLLVEQSLVRANDLSRVNVAFFAVNGVMSLVLAGLTIADVLLR
jgi:4-hydroxybenzoate polyprenyltransferase